MFAFKDFAPARTKTGFLGRHHIAALEKSLDDANAWNRTSGVRVVRIETVVLPQMWEEEGSGPSDPQTVAAANTGFGVIRWYQFFRVWFETADAR